jgi:hypothetical protein
MNWGTLKSDADVCKLGHSFVTTNGGLGNTKFENEMLVFHRHDGQSLQFEAMMQTDLKLNTTIILLGNSKREKLENIVKEIETILVK